MALAVGFVAATLVFLPADPAVAAPTTLMVTSTVDAVDSNVGDGACRSSAGECTLRAAIQEANANPGADLISVVPGTYAIGIAPINENAANVGDFEILDPVTIEKASGYLGAVIIDGGNPLPSSPVIARGLDRLFEIHPGAGDVTLRNLTLQNGYSPEEGGAIQNWSLGKLTLDGVTVKDNYAEKAGGGLNHADLNDYVWTTEPPNLELRTLGRVEIKRSTFTGNGSAGGSGAAINNVSGGTITISDGSVVTLNPGPIKPDPLDPEEFVLVDPSDYPLAASAIANQARWEKAGTLKITDSTISLNASEGNGAGILNEGDSIVEITNSTITQNRTAAGGGGLYTEGGKVSVSGSTVSKNQAANGGGLYSGGHMTTYGLRGRFDVKGSQIFENIAENGGGLLNGGEAQLFVTDTTFTKNRSSDHGAAISSEDRSNMTLTRVTVTENESNGEGGGVWTHSERQHTIVDSTFTRNKAGVPMMEDGVLSDDVAGGGGLHTSGGPVTILRTTFDANEATEEGGGISMHNMGDVVLRDSVLKNNRAYDGGGMENSATRVTFERMLVQGNRAGGAGGGIYNTSSGEFQIIDSTIRDNVGVIGGGLANAPDNHLIIRGSLFLNNSARIARNEEGTIDEEAGHGGGLMSFADGESLIENTTFSGNKAAVAGGGMFHDADGELRLVHITAWRNSAPSGGAIGVRESDFVPPVPPAANSAVILKNSIVGGSLNGGSCDWYVRSEGGNLETGAKNTCFLAVTAETAESPIELGVRDRRGDPQLLAIADNDGPTMTHALQYGSLAIDSSEKPCSTVDQRGVKRPQNGKCDAGAYEFVGAPPVEDTTPPETYFTPGVDGPRQDSLETMAFTFRGEDNLTAAHELNFECRFFEIDPAEQQEPVEPWLPQPPEFRWNGCSSPWSTILFEEGMMNFEVRAIDRAGNIDPTPVKYLLSSDNMLPPDTVILEAPPAQTNSRTALFTFEGVSDFTPPQWFEYECRLDSNDPEMWLECFNPAMYSNLATGLHTFEVRAVSEVGGFEGDPTPAKYTWRVGPDPNQENPVPLTCDEANVTLTASADGWADQMTPTEGYMFHTELEVRSSAKDPGNGQPIVPENARAFFRFPLANDAPDCELVSATLRLYSEGHTEGRTLEAAPLAETWKESTLTWVSQPDPYPGVAPAKTPAGELYREWNVTDHVDAIFQGDLPNHGWVIRDQHESDTVDGGEHSFISREMPQVPPYEVTLPELELRFEPADSGPPPDRDQTFVDRAVECGQRITESTRLTADVTGCMGEGISIGAPNVILDLNGHKIESGLVLEQGQETGGFAGIRVNKPNVEVRGPGVVTNFSTGVLIGPGAIGSLVENVTAYKNGNVGIQIYDADDGRTGNVVRGNHLDSNYGAGVELIANAEGNIVEDNTFVQNAMPIHVYASHRNLIRSNDISGIILDPTLDSDAGIVIEGGSRDNILQDNNVSDTGDAGVKIHEGSHGTQVIGGLYVRNGDAGVIAELSDRIVIDGITSHQQSDGGVVLGDSSGSIIKNSDLRYNPSGISASNTNGLIVDGNDASESLQAGIELGQGIGMRITNNVANLSGGSGISLEGGAFDANGVAHGGALIADNVTNENAEDGISVAEGARHTIARNQAYNNAGYGIRAGGEPTPGEPADPNANIDGGGNRAGGNHAQLGIAPGPADAVQCLGVVCDTGVDDITPSDLTPPDTIIVDGPLGPNPSPTASTGSETAVFSFRGEDGPTGTAPSGMVFECRIDAPPDPVEPVEPDLEPPDPTNPELPEPPEGENWGECANPHTLLSLEPGKHVFEVRAHDWAGNFDLTPAKYEWTIHAGVDEEGRVEVPPVPPETRITAAPGELITDEAGTRYDTTNRSATLKFTGSDNLTAGYNLAYECRVYHDKFNDELTPADMPSEATLPFEPCSSAKQFTDLPYGGHIFQVRSVDLAGNKDVTPASHSWWIHPPPPDIVPPDTTITAGPDRVTVQTTATFEFTGSDNQTPAEEVTFQCRLDGAMASGEPAWTACTSPYTVTVNSSATAIDHVLQVRAVDLAGNVDDVNGTAADSKPDGSPAAYAWTVGAAPVTKTVFCGQKITQSIIVNNNLGDCLGHGLIVGAHNITIDLNGKTIDGKSIGAGILNNGFDSVTIRNGRLTDFDYGVMLNQGAQLNIVEGITAEKNQDAGIALGRQTWPEDPNLAPSVPVEGFDSGVDGNIIRSNTLVVNNNGVWLMNSAQDNVVRENVIGSTTGEAVFLDRVHANLVEGNDLQNSSKHAVLLEGATGNVVRENSISTAGSGILVSATTTGTKGIESSGNRIASNTLTDTAGPALEVDTSSNTELLDNVVTLSDSVAIELYLANDNVIRGNQVSGNKGGISLRGSSSNLIEDNDASDSDTTGIVLAGGSLSNIVRANVSSHNVGGGIYIGDETPAGQGTLIEGNITNSNKGMGIQASKPAHVFKDNVAFDNDSWGIHAGDPSNGRANVDGGGNIADGNKGPLDVHLKPQQCYNVRCTGGPGGGDQIAPSTTLMEAPVDPSGETVAVFRFTGADNASPVTFECRFDGGEWAACASPRTYNDLANNTTHTFEVRARDFSGNVDPTPATYTWSVVLDGLEASIDSMPSKVTTETDAAFEISANRDSGVTFQCAIRAAGSESAVDWTTAPSCTSPATFTDLEPGQHEFWVRVSDEASNYDTKMYSWTIGGAPVEAEVNCGQILTQSTKLTNDLVDCGGYGLIVGAPGITIDLDGHIVDGQGMDAGILNNGHDDVTIKNGMVSQFLIGVQLNPGTARNVVHNMRVEGNAEAGIALSDADQNGDGNVIRDNSITANVAGIALYSNTRNAVIRNNTLAANLGLGAIVVEFASNNLIEGNQIGQSGGSGVYMVGGGGNTVRENTIRESGAFGINAGEELLMSNDNLIQRNTIDGGGGGMIVAGNRNQVVNNTVTNTTGPGVLIEMATDTVVKGNDFSGAASGISVAESTRTLVEANNASGTLGSGIAIEEMSSATILRGNTASGNKGDGIEVTEATVATDGSIIEGNTTDGNGGEGISVEGSGHTIRNNVAQTNGGWGIYSVGGIDGGGNFAAGNMEVEQCFGVVCEIGVVPGAPDTWIVSGPADVDPATDGVQSNSRNASITYIGADEFTPLEEIVYECRIDSVSPTAWQDCEYPAEFMNLSPGEHTVDIRAIDMMGQGLADPTPASFTWTYVPLPSGVAPEITFDIVPPKETYLFDAVFTFHANEPDVTFQCKVDQFGWEPCGFEGAAEMHMGAFEWSFVEEEVGPHTFHVRAIDFEGNVSEASYTWSLLGITVIVTDGPGYIPPSGGPLGEPAMGGPVASTSAEIHFEAVPDPGDVTYMCRFDSLDPNGFFPCTSPFRVGPAYAGQTEFPEPLLVGDHMLEVYALSELMPSAAELETAEYEWEVLDATNTAPPETSIERAPNAADPSSTVFEFVGVDDLTPDFLLTYECQVTNGTDAPNPSAWEQCFSPFNLLDIYNYGDPEMSLTQHTFYVRAIDVVEPEIVDPTQPEFEGNPDPTPASFTWTPVADTIKPKVTISGGPADGATVGEEVELYTFFGSDNATPLLRLQFECAAFLTASGIANAEWQACDSPAGGGYDISGLEPGDYTVAVRAVDLAGNLGVAATRQVTVADAPVVTFLSGPHGRLDPTSGVPDGASGTENAVFTYKADQPGVTFECSLDGADFVPCNTPSGIVDGAFVHAAWVVDSGTHDLEVRATNAQGLVGLEARYEWVVELAPDATEPSTTITAGPENGTLDTVATFRFTGTDNRTPSSNLTFECALDTTTAWNSCVAPQQFSDLTRGSHTLNVRAKDAAGNFDSTPASYTWIVAPPPVATILSGPGVEAEQSTDRTATFTFSADVSPVTYHCWLDGKFNPADPADPSKPAPCDPAGQTYENLGLGDHLFAVRAVDQYGNIGVWEDSEFRVMPPEARITAAPADGTSTTATFRFRSDPLDPDATFYCALDGRPFGLCNETPVDGSPGTYEKTYNNLFAGEHSFQVQTLYTGVDWRGLPFEHTPIPAVHTWTVQDLTPPETTIDFGPPATTMSTSAYLQVSSNEQTATIECTLTGPNGPQTGGCEPGVVSEFTDLAPGEYTFTAVATDLSGNVDPSPATYSWMIGTPSGPANTPVGENVAVDLGKVTVTFFSVQTEGTTTADRLGGGPSMPEGYSSGRAQIYDISTTAAYSEPVSVCITYDPADFGETKSIRLLHFDGSAWLDITTLHNPFSTPARVCSSEVEGFSLFALTAASSGMAPETSILSGPTGPLNANGVPTSTKGSATFEFWSDQPDAITQCSVDGLPYVNCESPYTVGPLEAGEHEFMVQAVNDFGWVDLTPAVYEWEILGPDTTPPTTVITKGPAEGSQTVNYISTFEFSGADDFTPPLEFEYQCTLDGVDLGGCETPEQVQVLEAGPHQLVVQAIDAAGNIDPVGVTRNWTVVDMSYPDTNILSGPVEETTETTATFEFEGFEEITDTPVFEFECALDEQEFAPCTSPWTISDVTPGAHTLLVRAVDPEGNRDISPDYWEWLVLDGTDTTAPDTFITHSPPAGNSGPDVVFGFASNERVELFECAWGAGTPPAAPTTWEQCETVFYLQGLPSGQHWLWVRATDPVGNVDPTPAPGEQPFVWTVNAEPETTITSGPEDPTGEATAKFTFTSDQPNATFECSIDGLEFAPCTSPYTAGPFTPDALGDPFVHEFEVRAVNEFRDANNEQVMDLSPAHYEWSVQDIAPPETEFLGVEDATEQLLEPGIRFKFRGEDDWTSVWELQFECSFDNTTDAEPPIVEDCSEPGANDTYMYELPYSQFPAGQYEFQVRAIDVAGNMDETPAPMPPYEFTIEAEPETTITSTEPDITATGETTSRSITFNFTGTGASFLCRLGDENARFEECPGGVAGQATYTNLPYGENTFEVMSVGEFGTPDASPEIFTWIVGTDVPPDVTITEGPTTGTTSTTATFRFASTDPTATFSCQLDNLPVQPCTSPWTYEGLLAGEQNPHTFTVEASNPTLLESVVTNEAIHDWTITDDSAPETTLLAPRPTNPSGNEVVFHFTGSDNGTLAANLTFECLLDGAVDETTGEPAWAGCSSPHTVPDLTGGEHTFQVRATDQVPLTDASPASFTWDVIAPPLTTITNQAGGVDVLAGETSTSATGELSFFDQPGSTYECRLDAQNAVDPDAVPFEPCTSPRSYDLANGDHVFEVRATTPPLDGQGLKESPAARYTWTIDAADTTAPSTTIELAPANPTTSRSATFLFSGTDNLTAPADLTFECALDGAAFSGCQSGIAYTDLSLGEHTFRVRASDNAATPNVGASTSHTWMVEAAGAENTPAGSNVTVQVSGTSLTFANVTSAGTTSVSELSGTPSLPNGYAEQGALYYDVSTTAVFSGDVTVCLPYGGLAAPHVLHYVGGQWVDVTLEQQGDLVCGVVSSLSPFAVADATSGVAPETTIIQSPADPTIQDRADGANIRFQFTSTLQLSEFECSLDGAPFTGCGTPYDFSTTFGEHTLRVRAVSDTGVRDATPASYRWTVLARPVVTLTSDLVDQDPATTDVETERRSVEFTFTSDQAGSTFECQLTGETVSTSWQACTSPKTYENLALEEYRFEVRAIKNGNTSWLPAEYEWTVADRTAPVVTITSGPGGTVDEREATFEFTSSEPATFECSRDGGLTWTVGCASGFTYTNLDRGEHTFHVRATDLSEQQNVSEPVGRTWTVADLTAPSLTINQTPAATTAETTAQFAFSTSDNWGGAVTTECRLDGGAYAACASPKSYSGLSAAQHTFEVRSTDSAGNARTASYTWTVQDVVDPEAEITNVSSGSLVIEFTGRDDHTAAADLDFECRVDSEPYGACTSPKTYSDADLAAMTPGDHTFQVRAIDQAGNVGQPDNHAFTVADTKAPDTEITGHPAATTTNTTATFTFTGKDDGTAVTGLTFECSLDGAGFAACTSAKEYTGLLTGEHTFRVRATDAANNTDQSPATYSWMVEAPPPPVDTEAPDTSITAQPPATTTQTNASFEFGSSETGSTFECKLDAGAYAACTSPKAYSGLATGSHTFSVRATDTAGNVDQTPASYSWTIQSTTVDCGTQQTLTASADAWIDSGSTSSNKGADSILKVMSKSGGNLRALLRFNLPTLPQGCSVESATLRVYAKSAAGGRTLQVIRLGGSWTEGGVTWANQPATTGAAATTSSGTGYREWNVAGMVQAMYTGTNNGFLLSDATENQDAEQQFNSRESSTDRPQLVLKFGTGAPPDGVPETQITGNPLPSTSSTSATFTFAGTDDTTPSGSLTFECQLDVAETSSWTACTSPRDYSGLADGAHTFRVRAKDAAGNVDPTPAVYTWTIDRTEPETVITSSPSSSTSTSARLAFQSPETGTTFTCSLDAAPFTACTSPKDYTNLTVGQHTFRVRATDAAGNVDQTPATTQWTVQPGGDPVNCGSAQTMTAVADAWVDQSSSSSNKGSDSILKVMSKSGNANLRTFVRFNLPTIPQGCVLDTAKLRLYASSASGTQRTLQVFRVAGAWTESGVTWANAPGTTGTAATTTSATGYREWNVAALVQAMFSSGSNHGFLVKDATEGQDAEQQFHAREKGSNVPQLVLTFKPAS